MKLNFTTRVCVCEQLKQQRKKAQTDSSKSSAAAAVAVIAGQVQRKLSVNQIQKWTKKEKS